MRNKLQHRLLNLYDKNVYENIEDFDYLLLWPGVAVICFVWVGCTVLMMEKYAIK